MSASQTFSRCVENEFVDSRETLMALTKLEPTNKPLLRIREQAAVRGPRDMNSDFLLFVSLLNSFRK